MLVTPTRKDIAVELERLFPGESLVPTAILDVGFRSVVVETNTNHVFLIGRHPAAAKSYEKDAKILPAIQPQLPIPVPKPDWFIQSTAAFPNGALRYKNVPGTPLTWERVRKAKLEYLAAQLGGFLRRLHSIDIDGFRDFAQERFASRVEKLSNELLPALRTLLKTQEYDAIAKWFSAVAEDSRMTGFAPTLVHGDLWYENILVNKELQQIVGIVDFENAMVGDPAQDFAPQNYIGADFLDAVLQAYGVPERAQHDLFLHRIQRYWELREFGGVQYALEYDDEVELEDSIGKIRSGPILRGLKA